MGFTSDQMFGILCLIMYNMSKNSVLIRKTKIQWEEIKVVTGNGHRGIF